MHTIPRFAHQARNAASNRSSKVQKRWNTTGLNEKQKAIYDWLELQPKVRQAVIILIIYNFRDY